MKTTGNRGPEQRHDTIKSHLIEPERHDPYKSRGKPAEPTACRQCGAVFEGGRWRWAAAKQAGAREDVCPACHRINDRYPAGEITLTGSFVAAHGDEIVGLVRNTEAAEKREHPLQRLIAIDEAGGRIVITTTDIHLPRRIGHAIVAAYKGDLETHYDEGGYFVRMRWSRDA